MPPTGTVIDAGPVAAGFVAEYRGLFHFGGAKHLRDRRFDDMELVGEPAILLTVRRCRRPRTRCSRESAPGNGASRGYPPVSPATAAAGDQQVCRSRSSATV